MNITKGFGKVKQWKYIGYKSIDPLDIHWFTVLKQYVDICILPSSVNFRFNHFKYLTYVTIELSKPILNVMY